MAKYSIPQRYNTHDKVTQYAIRHNTKQHTEIYLLRQMTTKLSKEQKAWHSVHSTQSQSAMLTVPRFCSVLHAIQDCPIIKGFYCSPSRFTMHPSTKIWTNWVFTLNVNEGVDKGSLNSYEVSRTKIKVRTKWEPTRDVNKHVGEGRAYPGCRWMCWGGQSSLTHEVPLTKSKIRTKWELTMDVNGVDEDSPLLPMRSY